MYDEPSTFASYWEGQQAFRDGNSVNPYFTDDEQHGPWRDGWYEAFDQCL
jgi:hypothetical protein